MSMLHQSALAAVGSSYELFSKLRRSQCLCSRSSKWHFPKSCLLSSPICPTIKFWKMTISFCITRGKPWRQVASRTPSGCDSYFAKISKLPKFRGATNEVYAIVLEYGRKTVQRFVPLSSPTSPHFTHTFFKFFPAYQDPQWRQRFYTPTTSDAAVLCYHRWLQDVGGAVQWGRPPDHLVKPKGRDELVERFQSQLGSRKRLHHRELKRTTFWTFRNMLPFGLHIPLGTAVHIP